MEHKGANEFRGFGGFGKFKWAGIWRKVTVTPNSMTLFASAFLKNRGPQLFDENSYFEI